ncbi:MAG: nuclear transport factor 2 family protein [Arenibacter sp.]|nr:nuclear transport factor 2 family protein [Arenibacter sp.]
MKKVIFMLAAIVLVASCQEKATPPMEEEMVNPAMEKFQMNVETTKAFLAAFSTNDSTNMESFVTDDFIWSPPSVGQDSLSKEEWMTAMKGFMKAYSDKELTDAQFYAGLGEDQQPNGDVRVYGLWKSKFASSGKDSRLKYYAVYFFNDEGKIVHQADWYDTADLTKEF